MALQIARRIRDAVLRTFVSGTQEPPTSSSELTEQERADAEYVRRSITRLVRRARAARLREEAFDDFSNSEDLRQCSGGARSVNQRASPNKVGTDFKPRRRMSL